MKKILFIVAYCALNSFVNAQEIEYAYDNAGNRIIRKVYVLRPAQKSAQAVETTQTPLEDKAGEFEFTLFPNPTRDILNISVNDLFLEERNKELTVMDMNGKLVVKKVVEDRITDLDFSSCTPGSYIVRMSSEGHKVREWKIIRE